MPVRLLSLLAAVSLAAACDKNAEPVGMKPEPITASSGGAEGATGGGSGDPHAGMDMNDPHAGVDMGDPHAGMNMGEPHGGGMEANPHGGGSAEPVDPKLALDGRITVDPKLAGQVKPGDIIFLAARRADEKGQPIGGPIGVARLDVTALPMSFHLDGNNVMMLGTGKFEGAVVLMARVDRDGEARTKEAGDIEGRVSATIPQSGLELVLDTPVQ